MTGTREAILDTIRELGYFVSSHNLPCSLYGKIPACVEMHAVKVTADPPEQFIVKFIGEGEEAEYQCACALAKKVGINSGGTTMLS